MAPATLLQCAVKLLKVTLVALCTFGVAGDMQGVGVGVGVGVEVAVAVAVGLGVCVGLAVGVGVGVGVDGPTIQTSVIGW